MQILIPAKSPLDWKPLLAQPDLHWKAGKSAWATAHAWQLSSGFPVRVREVLALSEAPSVKGVEPLLAVPEQEVALPGGTRASQTDLWVLGRCDETGEMVSIAVEGKVSESFGPTMAEWMREPSEGKRERLAYLQDVLGVQPTLEDRYQLVHRTASALLLARRFNAKHAVMLVHSFSSADEHFSDFERFASLFSVRVGIDQIGVAASRAGTTLHLAWVRGDPQYLGE